MWGETWRLPPGRETGGVGITLSGGGIRSAVFALGATHRLRAAGFVASARYLVGVSGGGYAAGAMRLALQPAPGHERAEARPEDVFAPGTPEFDHLRRHGRYLAEGLREWLAALVVLLRGLLVTQLTLLCVAVLAGVRVTFDALPAMDPRGDPGSLEPGTAAATGPGAVVPDGRMSRSCVLAATIHYPDGRTGRLYVGRAVLTPQTPWSVRAHAAGSPAFPNDTTMDQWFEHRQFDAYHALGQHVGEQLAALALACGDRTPGVERAAVS